MDDDYAFWTSKSMCLFNANIEIERLEGGVSEQLLVLNVGLELLTLEADTFEKISTYTIDYVKWLEEITDKLGFERSSEVIKGMFADGSVRQICTPEDWRLSVEQQIFDRGTDARFIIEGQSQRGILFSSIGFQY